MQRPLSSRAPGVRMGAPRRARTQRSYGLYMTLALGAMDCSPGGGSPAAPRADLGATPDAAPPLPKAQAFALDNGVDNPALDGVAIRLGWSRLEPTEGSYSFTQLDDALAKVAAARKGATLHVFGAAAQGATPSWLQTAGTQFYTANGRTEPVPWDAVYLAKWAAFLPKLAEHLATAGSLPLVTRISIAVPVPEMNLFSCTRGLLDSSSIAFDRAKYLAAWKQMVDVYQSAFPSITKLISAPQNGICLNDGDTQFFREVMDYALSKDGKRFGMFAADLSALGSARIQPYVDLSARAPISFQPVAAFSNDPNRWVKGTLLALYCAGLKLGGSYFEVYSEDLNNPDPAVQRAIGAIHDPSLCP